MQPYQTDTEALMRELHTGPTGLTEQEAARRLEQNGPNRLAEAPRPGLIRRFLVQINDPMVIILLAAAVLSAAFEEPADCIIIAIVVLLNACLGLYQEGKAERAIEALRRLSAPQTHVRREGLSHKIPTEHLVVGDIVELNAGDAVPADLRIIECANLRADESSLTGESRAIEKQADKLSEIGEAIPLGDRANMLYAGSNLVYGRGAGVVTACGMATEMGKIAASISSTPTEKTPLQKRLAELSRLLSLAVLAICVFIFTFSLVKSGNYSGGSLLDTFMLAVSLAVAAIPEGMVVVVTLVLSLGVGKMSKENAIIRRITAVETLGCTEVICCDKTGTLTQNKMTVVEYSGPLTPLAAACALCNDALLAEDGQAEGEPTEAALLAFAHGEGYARSGAAHQQRVGELAFESNRKMMSVLCRDEQGAYHQYSKGAPEAILAACSHYYDQNRQIRPLTEDARNKIRHQAATWAGQALRVLAAAEQHYESAANLPARQMKPEQSGLWEQKLTFIGLTGLLDPLRPEARPAIEKAAQAGIATVMITGDHKDTAAAIARDLGILTDDTQVIEGRQLDTISDQELAQQVEKWRVYARVQPEHKMRIVAAWQKRGHITAMTGDGVNDAPALKKADIGIGMGITGSDVSKSVADMILADDNFSTIIAAVAEGRRIYENIRKALQFLLASNLAEVLAIFIATLLGLKLFLPIHLLWINLVTDCFPAIALGMEAAEGGVMQAPPRKAKASIFAGAMGWQICWQGFATALLTLASFLAGLTTGPATATSMAFITLSSAEIFHAWNMRSRTISIFRLKDKNPLLTTAMIVTLLLNLLLLYTPLAIPFRLVALSGNQLALSLMLALLMIPLVELAKATRNRKQRGNLNQRWAMASAKRK